MTKLSINPLFKGSLLFLLLVIFSCSKQDEADTSVNRSKLKLDSIITSIPKSIKVNLTDSTVITEDKDGTITKSRLTKSLIKKRNAPVINSNGGDEMDYSLYEITSPNGGQVGPTAITIVCFANYTIGTSNRIITMVSGMASVLNPANYTVLDPDGTSTTYAASLLNQHYSFSSIPSTKVYLSWEGEIFYRITVNHPGQAPQTSTSQTDWSSSKTIPEL